MRSCDVLDDLQEPFGCLVDGSRNSLRLPEVERSTLDSRHGFSTLRNPEQWKEASSMKP